MNIIMTEEANDRWKVLFNVDNKRISLTFLTIDQAVNFIKLLEFSDNGAVSNAA